MIVVTNPVDIMTYSFLNTSNFPENMVVGMGNNLDTARLKSEIIKKYKSNNIKSYVMGNHSDDMLIYYHLTERENLSLEDINSISNITKNMGLKINKLSGTSAYYSPAAAVIDIAISYILDERRIIPCSIYSEKLCKKYKMCTGFPVVISRTGVGEIDNLKISKEQMKTIDASLKLNEKLFFTL